MMDFEALLKTDPAYEKDKQDALDGKWDAQWRMYVLRPAVKIMLQYRDQQNKTLRELKEDGLMDAIVRTKEFTDAFMETYATMTTIFLMVNGAQDQDRFQISIELHKELLAIMSKRQFKQCQELKNIWGKKEPNV